MFYLNLSLLKLRVIFYVARYCQFELTREGFNNLHFQILFFQLQFRYDKISYDSSLTITEIRGLFPVCVGISPPILDTVILISRRFFQYQNQLFWLTLTLPSRQLFLVRCVDMFTKNIFLNIVVKRGFRPVEKRVHARVNMCQQKFVLQSSLKKQIKMTNNSLEFDNNREYI